MSVRVRYAPSPTGSPHVGNIRTAIFNWLLAHKLGGQFITRLEDTDRDPERYKPEYIKDIEDSLTYLGTVPDEWWVTGGPAGPYVQSERLETYKAAAEELIAKGWAYRCFCTPERLAEMRAEQQARGVPSGYDRRCRRLSAEDSTRYVEEGKSYTVRLAVPLEGKTTYRDEVYGEITFENKLIDDQVLLKSNGWPTYHLAVVLDDHAMGITHVLRGEDWQPSTPKQILLYQAFGWEPPIWVHLPLIIGVDKKKLSKRHGATQFTEFQAQGYLPEALFNFLILLGWSAGEENRELFTKDEIVERFSIGGINNSPAVFDYDKLRWMNGHYIRQISIERLIDLCLPYLVEAGYLPQTPTTEERAYLAQVLPLAIERMKLLSEAPALTDFFYIEPTEPEEKGKRKWLTGPDAIARLDKAIELFSGIEGPLTIEAAEQATNSIAESLGLERGPVIHTLRISVTGRTVGPGLFELMAVLGKERVLARLQHAKSWIVE
jgi:glutamyl-tRNA synthetase